MNTTGRFPAASRRKRRFVLSAALLLPVTVLPVWGAVADLLPEDPPQNAPALENQAERKADALAWFANGLFEEESEGPEKALDSYRKALTLDPGNVELAVRLSSDYLRRGDSAEALSVLKDAAKAAPKDPTPCLALSTIYLRHLHKVDLAIKYAQAGLEADPKVFASYAALWEIYQSRGQTAKADQVLEKASRAKSTAPEFWLSLAQVEGRDLFREGAPPLPEAQFQKIEPFLAKAAEYGSKDPETLSKIGDVYLLSRQIDKAQPFYQKVVDIKPNYPQAREKLAGCYEETGQTDKAIKILEEIVELNPLHILAYDHLTRLRVKTGEFEKAVASAQQAVIIEPAVIERHIDFIKLLFETKQFDRAVKAIDEATKRFPRVSLLTYYQALALSEAKKPEEAMKAFEKTLVEAGNSSPDLLNAEFYFQYGAAAEQSKNYVKAAELFKKSIELDPSDAARAYNYLGYMWVDRNENLEEAGQYIRKALELEPGNGAYLDSLGWLYYRQGKYQEAVTELLRAAESLKEPDATVYDHIADAYEKLGKKSEAVLYWQKAYQLDPELKELAAKLDKATEKVVQQPAEPKAQVSSQTQDP